MRVACSVQRCWILNRACGVQRAEVLQEFADATSGALLCTDLAARGLDIPHVHWILQFDPPQDPSAFVHRCGRTARMGRSGNALAFLLPHEDAYVDLLAQRRIPLTQRDPEVDALDMVRSSQGWQHAPHVLLGPV